MDLHYKTRSWHDVIDPAFNKFIRQYLDGLNLVGIPSIEGNLVFALDDKHLKKIAKEGYPKFIKFYEKDNIGTVLDEIELLFSSDSKDVTYKDIKKYAKKHGFFIKDLASVAELIPNNESRAYYLKSFGPFMSEDAYTEFKLNKSKKDLSKYGQIFLSDCLSMIWHIGTVGIEKLRRDKDTAAIFDKQFQNHSRLLRRSMFSVWDTISQMNHRKSLKQLYAEGSAGDDQALFNLLQFDKTLFDHEWVRIRMRKAVYSGDIKFINDVADALKKEHFDTRKDNLDISIVLISFWKMGISRLTTRQKMVLLKDSGIRFNLGEDAFRQIVNRIRPFVK